MSRLVSYYKTIISSSPGLLSTQSEILPSVCLEVTHVETELIATTGVQSVTNTPVWKYFPPMTDSVTLPESPPDLSECLRYNLFVELKACHNLPAKKQHGSSDPFVKFVVGTKLVHKTRTVVRELNPGDSSSINIMTIMMTMTTMMVMKL